jgi:hypothetical protein
MTDKCFKTLPFKRAAEVRLCPMCGKASSMPCECHGERMGIADADDAGAKMRRRRMRQWIRKNVGDPHNHCFFYAAALAALFPGLTLVRGQHSEQHPDDTAHFWTEDEDGTIIDPTAEQYKGGEYSGGAPVSLEANLDAVVKDPLFGTLEADDREKILARSAEPVSGRSIGNRRYTSLLPFSKRAAARIKALSVRQPWANMIADGRKTIETRKWATAYRGPLLIVSSARPAIEPAGQAVAIADLVDCRPMAKEDERAAGCETYPSAQAWVLENVRKIEPFPVKGSLGLFEVEMPEQIRQASVPLSKRADPLWFDNGEFAKDHAYVGKRKEDSGNFTYLYDEKHIAARNKKKETRLKKLSKSLRKMRDKVKSDLTHEDEKIRLAALAVALIDETYERVGNEESASDLKHYGVTGWLLKHVTLGKGKATIKYVGKAGVKQSKEVKTKAVLSALRRACEGKKKGDRVLDGITAKNVNAYLAPFKITAKDIRGFHANKEMLRALKSNGKGKLPKDGKEREKALKERFKDALEDAAKKVGHEPGTLKRQYLIPRIEQYFMEGKGTGSILDAEDVPFSKRADGDEDDEYPFQDEEPPSRRMSEEEEKAYDEYWENLGRQIEEEERNKPRRKQSEMTLEEIESMAEMDSEEREEFLKHFEKDAMAMPLSKRARRHGVKEEYIWIWDDGIRRGKGTGSPGLKARRNVSDSRELKGVDHASLADELGMSAEDVREAPRGFVTIPAHGPPEVATYGKPFARLLETQPEAYNAVERAFSLVPGAYGQVVLPVPRGSHKELLELGTAQAADDKPKRRRRRTPEERQEIADRRQEERRRQERLEREMAEKRETDDPSGFRLLDRLLKEEMAKPPLSRRAETEEDREFTFLYQLVGEVLRGLGGYAALEHEWQRNLFDSIADALWKKDMPRASRLVDKMLRHAKPPASRRASLRFLWHYAPIEARGDIAEHGLKTPYSLMGNDKDLLEKYRERTAETLGKPKSKITAKDVLKGLEKRREAMFDGEGGSRALSAFLEPIPDVAGMHKELRAFRNEHDLYRIDYQAALKDGTVEKTAIVEEKPRSERPVEPGDLMRELEGSEITGSQWREKGKFYFSGKAHAMLVLKGGIMPPRHIRLENEGKPLSRRKP